MKKNTLVLICAILLTCVITNIAVASEVMPLADSEFDIASALLSTRKDVSFSCSTYEVKSTIKITSCWLQKKSGNNWVWVCSLTAPSTVAYNTDIYSALMDYSSKIGTGTFRVGFTVNADGHAITRYSNSRTF